ncbi:MAG: hypothetical protein AB9888_15400 [Bacteroidales bacterium]
MSRLFIFTCGRSLLTNFGRNCSDVRGRDRLQSSLDFLISEKLQSIDEIYQPDASWRNLDDLSIRRDPDFSEFLQIFNHDLGKEAVGYWSNLGSKDKEQSAEVATKNSFKIKEEDEIVILASDTPDGVLCALINAHLMARQGQKVYLEFNDWQSREKREGLFIGRDLLKKTEEYSSPVRVIVVTGLNPTIKTTFERIGIGNLIRTLIHLVYEKIAQGNFEAPFFVFTGGFKAGIPILTQAAGWLGGITKKNILMNALYEDSVDRIDIPIIGQKPDPKWLLIAHNFGRRDHPSKAEEFDYSKFDYSKIESLGEVRKDVQFLFQSKQEGGIELNPIGQALKAIVEHDLSLESRRKQMEMILSKAAK